MQAAKLALKCLLVLMVLVVAVAPIPASARSSSSPTAATTYYLLEDLGKLPGHSGSVAWGINEAGQVVGWSTGPDGTRAFVYTDGVGMVELPGLPDRPNTLARDINDNGQIVGSANAGGTDLGRAVRWTNGVIQDLGTLPDGSSSEGWGINNAGHVVGRAGAGFASHAFLYTDEQGMIDLTPGSSAFSAARDINDAGQITGYRTLFNANRAFRWENGEFLDLGVLPNFGHSFGYAINEIGQVAGNSETAQGDTSKIIRYTDGVGLENLGGGAQHDQAWGINSVGVVVGEARLNGLQRGFVADTGTGLQSLTDLLVSAPGWGILAAHDINDTGQIVGAGYNSITGETHAVRLTPTTTPPPSCSANCLRVDDISLSAKARKGVVEVSGLATVKDENGNVVRDAAVFAHWTLPSGESQSQVAWTDRKGVARFATQGGSGTYTLTIDNVEKSQFTFDPDNSVLSKSITQ